MARSRNANWRLSVLQRECFDFSDFEDEDDDEFTESQFLYELPDQVLHQGVIYPWTMQPEYLDMVREFPLHSNDVLIASYPRAGATWLQEMIYLLYNGGNVDKARDRYISERVPFLENMGKIIQLFNKQPPRLMKTQLPPEFFEQSLQRSQPKVIVLMRNIKDTLVSYYHFYTMNGIYGRYDGSWNDFFHLFKEGQLAHGHWMDMNLKWWGLRGLPNILYLTYEDMHLDPGGTISKVASFCGIDLSSNLKNTILENTTFQVMKTNPAVNHSEWSYIMDFATSPFMRSGQVGQWRKYFSPIQNDFIKQMLASNLKGTGLEFKYDLNSI